MSSHHHLFICQQLITTFSSVNNYSSPFHLSTAVYSRDSFVYYSVAISQAELDSSTFFALTLDQNVKMFCGKSAATVNL